MAVTKFLKQVAGVLTEDVPKDVFVGVADAGKLTALNAAGVLDPSLLNATIASAGAGSSGKVVALDASGRIDATVLPTGIGADVAIITTSEALASGDYVNVWNSTGAKVRKADATVAGKEAMGFVLVGVGSGAPATVYFEGTNTAVTGQTPGKVFLQTTAGLGGTTPPVATGNVVQNVGFAISATAVNFQSGTPITLA